MAQDPLIVPVVIGSPSVLKERIGETGGESNVTDARFGLRRSNVQVGLQRIGKVNLLPAQIAQLALA